MNQIIYILGSGHSGSTLLDRILGSHQDCFSVGEIRQWNKAMDKPELFIKEANVECSCGKVLKDCNFYTRVTDNFSKIYHVDAHMKPKDYLSLIYHMYVNRKLDGFKPPDDNYLDLLSDISKTTYDKFLIDSSKTLINLIKLLKSGKYQVKLIYLSRDIRGVGNSYNKIPYYNFYLSVFNWIVSNHLYRKFLKKLEISHITIGYDNLAMNPDLYIKEIGSWLSLDISEYADRINHTEYHQIAGNNVRFKEFKGIKYDKSWKTELGFFKRLLVQWVGLFFNKSFVYRDTFYLKFKKEDLKQKGSIKPISK